MSDQLRSRLKDLQDRLAGDKKLPAPLGLCPDCAKRRPERIELYLVIYCPHHHAGACFETKSGIWTIVSPVTPETFGAAMGAAAEAEEHLAQAAQAGAPPMPDRH